MEFWKWVFIFHILFTLNEACRSRCRRDNDDLWAKFKKVHHKKYCKSEDQKRKCIFEKTVCRIEKHNLEYDLGLRSFRRGLNKYSDLTHEEFVSKLNGFRGTPDNRRKNRTQKRAARSLSSTSRPRSLDWRDKGLVTRVRDQGICGSCYAFSAVGSLEGQMIKRTNRTVLLSEQNLVDCSSSYGNRGCEGGLMTQSFDYIIDNGGIQTANSYPYREREGRCRFQESNIGATCSSYNELNYADERELLDALVRVGPISVGIDASRESFQDYKAGIYDEPSCSNEYLDHAVLLIGYGTEDGVDYWLIKNSYGTSWGENGFGKMVRNKSNQCGIATQACYPIV